MFSIFTLLIIVAGILFVIAFGWGIFWVLVQVGVIVQKASEPPTTDTNNYSLGQGRDIGEGDSK